MKKITLFLLSLFVLLLSTSFPLLAAEHVQGPTTFPTVCPCNDVIIINKDTTISDQTINKNIYIAKNATLTTEGTVTIDGDVFVFGTLDNYGYIIINQSLYCLNYQTFMSAGNYNYGYFWDHGDGGHIHALGVFDKYLSYGIPTLIHTWSEWEVSIQETCTMPGFSTRTCSLCGSV